MANIDNELNKIKNAVYGKDVRGAIHDGIEKVYNDATKYSGEKDMEVVLARGSHSNLNDRLNKTDHQLAQKTDKVIFNEFKDVTELAVVSLDAKIDGREPPEPIIIENLWDLENTEIGILSVSNGTLNPHHSTRTLDFTEVLPGRQYTISTSWKPTIPTIQFVEYESASEESYITGKKITFANSDDESNHTITLDPNTNYVRITVNLSSQEDFVFNIGDKPMTEEEEGDIWDGGFWQGIPTPPLRKGSVKSHHIAGKSITEDKLSDNLISLIESIPEKESMPEKGYYFTPEEIVGYYRPSDESNYAELWLNRSSTSLQDYYDKYDLLIEEHSDYLTKSVYGKDESGIYDVFNLTIKPYEVPSNSEKTLPKISIITGTHGSEKNAQYALYYFIRDLCENWENNPSLEYLRWNVEFQIIPCANPWAFENGAGRKNYNGVDLNRNQEPGWKFISDTESTTYAGTHPLSEVESRYIKTFIDDNADSLFLGDYHNHFTQPPNSFLWHALPPGSKLIEPIEIASMSALREGTLKIANNYNLDIPLTASKISYGRPDGRVRDYGAYKGIPSITMECFPYLNNMTSFETSIQAATEYTGNWFLSVLRTFKDRC